MRKIALVIVLGLSINLLSCTSNSIEKDNKTKTESMQSNSEDKEVEKADNYEFSTSLEKGYFIRKTIQNGDMTKDEIYNKASLDKLVEDINNKNSSELVSVEYLYDGAKYTINKLRKICYDGNKVIEKSYDTISNKEEFVLTDTVEYSMIIVKDYGDDIKYSFSTKDKDEIKLLSFKKSEVVN